MKGLDAASIPESEACRPGAVSSRSHFQVTRIGVLALQGDVSEHITALAKAAADSVVIEVRAPGPDRRVPGIGDSGGESTTIRARWISSGITESLVAAARSGKPVLATCAGMVLVSR